MVTPSYSPIIGGSETLTRNLAISLNQSGIQTDIMTFNMAKKWNIALSNQICFYDGVQVIKVPGINPLPMFNTSPLYTAIRINVLPFLGFKKKFDSYDVIHFVGEADLSMPFLSSSVKKPKIMHCVGIPEIKDQFNKHKSMKKVFFNLLAKIADLYIVFSPEEKKVLVEFGISPNRIMILPYGVDTTFFRPKDEARVDNLVLFVGRIYPPKGLHILLEALKHLDIATKTVIIGPAEDSGYFEQMKTIMLEINNQGIHDVQYVGPMNQQDLVNWYQKARVLVRADLTGASGAGSSTLEALACGIPVIGVQNHVIVDGENGLLVPHSNALSVAAALRTILEDKKFADKLGERARRTVQERYSLDRAVDDIINVYRILLTER